MSDLLNRITYSYESLDEAFPPCDPLIAPAGSRVLVQVKTPKKKTAGGIMLPSDVRETEFWVSQIAKVRGIGPVAFKDRKTLEPWPEGAWCKEGDFVRVPKHGGDRWTISLPGGDEALMIMFNDLDIIGYCTGDPLAIKAYL